MCVCVCVRLNNSKCSSAIGISLSIYKQGLKVLAVYADNNFFQITNISNRASIQSPTISFLHSQNIQQPFNPACILVHPQFLFNFNLIFSSVVQFVYCFIFIFLYHYNTTMLKIISFKILISFCCCCFFQEFIRSMCRPSQFSMYINSVNA